MAGVFESPEMSWSGLTYLVKALSTPMKLSYSKIYSFKRCLEGFLVIRSYSHDNHQNFVTTERFAIDLLQMIIVLTLSPPTEKQNNTLLMFNPFNLFNLGARFPLRPTPQISQTQTSQVELKSTRGSMAA